MENEFFCQSCSMPLDNPELQGTEKDGSKSKEYCRYCYLQGEFTKPGMTLKEMIAQVITEMEKMKIDSKATDMAISSLPNLKRWKNAALPV